MVTKVTRDVFDGSVRPITTIDIDGGTIDGAVIGGVSPAAATVTTLTATSATLTAVTSGNATISGGSINGTLIGNSSPSTGTFSTMNSSNAVISGGTINSTVIGNTTPAAGTFTTMTATNAVITGGTINGAVIGGVTPAAGTFTNLTGTNAAITGGNINGTIIGNSSAAAGTFTNLTATGTVSLAFRGALVIQTSPQSIANGVGVGTMVSWSSAVYDTSSFWSAGAPTRLTIPANVNRVRLGSRVVFASNSTNNRTIRLFKNNSIDFVGRTADGDAAADNIQPQFISPILVVTPGDYFEVRAEQDSGGALNTNPMDATNSRMWFSIEVIN